MWLAVLFAEPYDVSHLDLKKTSEPSAIAPIALLLAVSLVFLFSDGTAKPVGAEGPTIRIEDVRTTLGSRISNLQATLDGVSGASNEPLTEENTQLKAQLEAIQQAEQDNSVKGTQKLRSRNEVLEEQIRQLVIKPARKIVSSVDVEARFAV